MEQLLLQRLPNPIFDIFPEFPTLADDLSISVFLDDETITQIAKDFELTISATKLDIINLAPLIAEQSATESNEPSITETQPSTKNFAEFGCTQFELQVLCDQIFNNTIQQLVPNNFPLQIYLSPISCFQLYKLNSEPDFAESLLYLCQLTLTRHPDPQFLSFSQKVIYHYYMQIHKNLETVLSVCCLSEDIWLLMIFQNFLTVEIAFSLLSNQISETAFKFIVKRYILDLEFVYFLVKNGKNPAQILPELSKLDLLILSKNLHEIVEMENFGVEKCNLGMENGAVMYLKVVNLLYSNQILCCGNCGFPSENSCFKCDFYAKLTNFEMQIKVENSVEYQQLFNIQQYDNPQNNKNGVENFELGIDSDTLINYAILRSQAAVFTAKLVYFFTIHGSINQVKRIIAETLILAQNKFLQFNSKAIFHSLFTSKNVQVSHFALSSLPKIFAAKIDIIGVLEQIVFSANSELETLNSKSKITSFQTLIREIYTNFAPFLLLENDVTGLALLQNLISNVQLEIEIQFDFPLPFDEFELSQIPQFFEQGAKSQILFQQIVSCAQLGLLFCPEILKFDFWRAVRILEFLICEIQRFKMGLELLLSLSCTLTFYAKIHKISGDFGAILQLLKERKIENLQLFLQLLKLLECSNNIDKKFVKMLQKNQYIEIVQLSQQIWGVENDIEIIQMQNQENSTAKISTRDLENFYFQCYFSVQTNFNTTERNSELKLLFNSIQEKLADFSPQSDIDQLYINLIQLQQLKSGLLLPKTALRQVVPILVQSRNESVLHSAKSCLATLARRFRGALRFEFVGVLKTQKATANLNLLTWLFVLRHIQLEEREVLGMERLLAANLLYVGLVSGRFRVRWARENWFLDDFYRRVRDAEEGVIGRDDGDGGNGLDAFVSRVMRGAE
ncbi:hypothetical protein SS50377_22942 [Spironucleus salmonicida]|uniref:Uncharacterized protein n=1 Tax=Spironucleus salmonicida TaxID=348837 RepID=V6LWB4_9EUKA|nr:hypothetical protein SS50377_22942 [Spironucleus salmonicida]|eukprot:EST48001.1 Hypothetical protein SS50377_11919 [Spironucleus salmonicida]